LTWPYYTRQNQTVVERKLLSWLVSIAERALRSNLCRSRAGQVTKELNPMNCEVWNLCDKKNISWFISLETALQDLRE
jgi:hypothetical protein